MREAAVGMQYVICEHVDEPHPPAYPPFALIVNFHPPVVVLVSDSILPEACHFLLSGARRGDARMTVEISPGQHVLKPHDLAILDRLPLPVATGLSVRGLDAPEIVGVRPFERSHLLLA
jgi:hypothetical protein